MGINDRLKEERTRLGYTQPAFAALVGVSKSSLVRWEAGNQSPDIAVLAEWAKVGLDVLYVVTGQRTPQPVTATESSLTPRQKALLDNFENLSEMGKRHVEEAGFLLAEQDRGATSQRAGSKK